jgi:hypothetical protein
MSKVKFALHCQKGLLEILKIPFCIAGVADQNTSKQDNF